jgi:hypothetical protein
MKEAVQAWLHEENIILISKVLKTVRPIPFYGTLLGLTRNGSAIDGDDDVDFWIAKSKRSEVISLLENTPFEIDFSDAVNHTDHFLQAKRKVGLTTTIVDFYFYETSLDGQVIVDKWNFTAMWTLPANELHVPVELVFPLKPEMFWDVELYMPANKKALCEFLYGEGWIRPMSKGTEYTTSIVNNKPTFSVGSADEQTEALKILNQCRGTLHAIELKMGALYSEYSQLNEIKSQVNTQLSKLKLGQA